MALDSGKDVQQLKNRLKELSEKSYTQNVYTFTGFLGLSEQDVFWQTKHDGFAGFQLWGGSEGTDRKVLRFGNPEEFGYEEPFPVICIHIRPLAEKFSDNFSHRDFLGALMNLGIDRSTIGDIKVGSKEGYLFCLDSIGDFICENLNKVKHTNVRCERVLEWSGLPEDVPEEVQVQVASERVDAVAAKVYRNSRGDMLDLFRCGKVYVDGRLCENNARLLKPGETVNVRGFGKFVYRGILHETKKGKLAVLAAVYM